MLLTAAEAADILALEVQSVFNLVQRGRLIHHGDRHQRHAFNQVEVEARSLSLLRRRLHEPHHYWATTHEAAEELGVSRQAVVHAIRQGRLPAERGANGRWYLRRHQLEVIANARSAVPGH